MSSATIPSGGLSNGGSSMGGNPTPSSPGGERGGNQSRKYSYIPLSQLADIRQTSGPPMVNSENSLLRSIVFLNVRGRDMGGFVADAKQALTKNLSLPPGYYVSWSGQYENQIRAKQRLEILLPIVVLIIFVMLYFTFKSFLEAGMVMLQTHSALKA